MSQFCDSSTRRCSGIAPTRTRYAVPGRGPVSSDCESCHPREPLPAATAALEAAAERQALSESVGKNRPFFSFFSLFCCRFYQFRLAGDSRGLIAKKLSRLAV